MMGECLKAEQSRTKKQASMIQKLNEALTIETTRANELEAMLRLEKQQQQRDGQTKDIKTFIQAITDSLVEHTEKLNLIATKSFETSLAVHRVEIMHETVEAAVEKATKKRAYSQMSTEELDEVATALMML